MSILRPGPRWRNPSQHLRAEAERYRRRAEEAERWGNEDLAPLRVREYLEYAERLERAAEAAERKEERR